MKRNAILVLLAGCCLFACQENDALPAMPEEEVIELMRERIEANAILLDSAYRLTTALLAEKPVSEKMLAESSKLEFITAMNKLTSHVFSEAIEKCRNELSLEKKSYLPEKERKDIFIGYVLSDEPDPLGDYAAKIQADAATAGGRDKDRWIHIESFVIETPSHGNLPTETLSLNFEKIKLMHTVFGLIMKHEDEGELNDALNKFTAEHADTSLVMGLLLPAVQRVREAALRHATLMDAALAGSVFGGKKPGNMPLLLQRQRAAAFLGGLELLVRGDYDNSTVDTTSINVLYAMHQNMMTMLWSQVWDHYRE